MHALRAEGLRPSTPPCQLLRVRTLGTQRGSAPPHHPRPIRPPKRLPPPNRPGGVGAEPPHTSELTALQERRTRGRGAEPLRAKGVPKNASQPDTNGKLTDANLPIGHEFGPALEAV